MDTRQMEMERDTLLDSKKIKPKYYSEGIETWDFIISKKLDFLEGNIVKYVVRYKEKNGLEDLHKAMEYLKKLIAEKAKETR